jgi:hypothetical protein
MQGLNRVAWNRRHIGAPSQSRLTPRASIDRLLPPDRNQLRQSAALYHGSNRREKDDVFEVPPLLIPCTIVEILAGSSTMFTDFPTFSKVSENDVPRIFVRIGMGKGGISPAESIDGIVQNWAWVRGSVALGAIPREMRLPSDHLGLKGEGRIDRGYTRHPGFEQLVVLAKRH